MHVVPFASRLRSDERAFVEVLPKNSCGCDAPGNPGRTIGSSGAKWLRRQTLKKFVPCGAGGIDAAPAPDASAQPIPIRCMEQIDARRLRIGFDLPAGPTCRVLDEVRVVEGADAVSVGLFLAATDDPAAGACPDEPMRAATEIDLQAPVAGRTLLDGFAESPSGPDASTMSP